MTHTNSQNDRGPLPDSVRTCLRKMEAGIPSAAEQLWGQYRHRIIGLARARLGRASFGSMDENDVAQEAFFNFCHRAQSGDFADLRDHDGLWALLAVFTARTAANCRLHQRRAKRGGGLINVSGNSGDSNFHNAEIADSLPSAEELIAFESDLERFMETLDDPIQRVILLWKLESRTNPEIARHLDCSLSTVERTVQLIRMRLASEIS